MKLKPCPFCGSENTMVVHTSFEDGEIQYHDLFRIRCDGCDMEGPDFYEKPKAIETWNRRVGDEALS